MSEIKKNLLQEIRDRVLRKKNLRDEIASRNANIEAFVIKMINDIEDMIYTSVNPSLVQHLAPLYTQSFQEQIRVIDTGATLEIKWNDVGNSVDMPKIDGILITWSKEYQTKNNCEEQLFIDVLSLMLK